MSEDIIKYIAYAIEEYKRKNDIDGARVARFFKDNNIYDFIVKNYGALHTQSAENLVLDIDEYAKNRKRGFNDGLF